MLLNWDWDKEVASWHERKKTETSNKRHKISDRGGINLPHNHRHSKCEDRDCYDINACDRNVRRSYEISLPITVRPYAITGDPDACCGGDVKIKPGHKRCDSKSKCHDFTVSQIINVQIPIDFGAEICYEDFCSEERGRCDGE